MKNFRNKLLSLLAAAALMVTMVPAALALEDVSPESAPQLEVAEIAAETVTFRVYHFYLSNAEPILDTKAPDTLLKTDTTITTDYAKTLAVTKPGFLVSGNYELTECTFHTQADTETSEPAKDVTPGSGSDSLDLTNVHTLIIHLVYDNYTRDESTNPNTLFSIFHYYGDEADALNETSQNKTISWDSKELTEGFAEASYKTNPATAGYPDKTPANGGIYRAAGFSYNVSYNNLATSEFVPTDTEHVPLEMATATHLHLVYNLYYPVTATVTGNGDAAVTCIDPNDDNPSDNNYRSNATVTVTFSAADGYHITAVTDNGKSVGDFSSGELVLEGLDAAHNIVVTTAPDEGTIDPTPEPEPNPNPNPNPQPVDPQPTAPIDPVVPVLPEEPIVLPENVTPLAPAPEAPVTSTEDGVILIDAETPLGDLPQTGMTPAALSVAAAALMALSALVACAGIFFKKRQNG